MKKICFFSGDITRPGGTERVAAAIANGLCRKGGYQVTILSIVKQNETPFFSLDPEIEQSVLKDSKRWISPGPGYLALVPAVRRFLKRHGVDVIVDVDLVLDSLSIPAAAGLPVKVVSWAHFHYGFEQKTWYRRRIARFAARFSDYMITLTPQDCRDYREKLGRKDRIDFIYNPVTPEFCGVPFSKNREKTLITIGWLNGTKGTDLLAEIAPAVLRGRPQWKWIFLGDGEHRPLLEETARRYHLEDRLVRMGPVAHVEEYLKKASICVLGSRSEGFGLSLLEAKACHVPCVAFDVAYGPAELIEDGVNGFLVPPFHLEQMAAKIALLMEDGGLWERFAQNTVKGLERFQLDTVLEQWDRLLNRLVGQE